MYGLADMILLEHRLDLSNKEKRVLMKAVEPLAKAAYWLYRMMSGGSCNPFIKEVTGRIDQALVRKVLVVRLDAIGDMLLSEPAIAAIKSCFPEARLDVIGAGRSEEILINNPNVDTLIPFSAPWHAAWRGQRINWLTAAVEVAEVAKKLRQEKYDLAFELRGDVRDILFSIASGAKAVCGSSFRGGGFLLDFVPVHNEFGHQVEMALDIAASAGASPTREDPRLYLTLEEKRSAEKVLQNNSVECIALHLGAGFPSKCLPIEKFAAVATALHRADSSRCFIVVGGPEDRVLADAFQSLAVVPTTDLVGKLSVRETAAVLERCSLFLGNDSAPMHLAAAGSVPVVTFFGPSEPWKFHPYGTEYRLLEVDLPCRPCDYVHCIHSEYLCMTRQSVDAIVGAAEELIALSKRNTNGSIAGVG
ncbi:MAG: glycosyltransferase family 9 protein [Dehalococcoidia bacterium]|nr:glycosyltransferase family 9 protein [Dehalococcoidia bacterium]